MKTATQTSFTSRDAARILFRHWRKAALAFTGISLLALLAVILYPRSYASEAKLFIRVGRESVGLDPTATTGQTIMLQKTQDAEVNSALDILHSFKVHELVVETIGAGRILEEPVAAASTVASAGTTPAKPSPLSGLLKTLRLSEPGSDLEMAVRRIEKGLKVSAPKNSTVITVRFAAGNSQLAHDVVDALVSAFLEEHVRLNRTDGSLAFFQNQVDEVFVALTAAQSELRDHKNKYHMASDASRRSVLQQQMENVELELLATARNKQFSEARIEDLSRQIGGLKPQIISNRVAGFANEAKDGMREKLYELELKEKQLQARYTEDHPLLVEVRKQRQGAEQVLAGLPDDRVLTTESINPNQRQAELDLLKERASAAALGAKHAMAQGQRAALIKEMELLNDQEIKLAELERNVALLDDKYRVHFSKLEQARVNDELDKRNISNVNIVQPATLLSKPVWPNKRLFVMLGLLAAGCSAVGVVLAAEKLDATLQTASQVEAKLGLPVLLTLPQQKRRRGKRKKRVGAQAVDGGGALLNGNSPKRSSSGVYESLVSQLMHSGAAPSAKARFVGVVGCQAPKSRSVVAAELAIRASRNGPAGVLLIDGDARRRRVAKRFHLNGSPGFREVVAGVAAAEHCIHRQQDSALAVMTYGGSNGRSASGPQPTGVARSLEFLRNEYRLVVVDLPSAPALPSGAGAPWIDGVLMVIEADKTRVQSAQAMVKRLERAKMPVLGVVLANRKDFVPAWLYRRL